MNQSAKMPPSHAKNVLMIVNTHVYDDPRVMLEAASLSKAGYQVRIIGAARLAGQPTRKNVDGIEIVLTPMVVTSNPLSLLRNLWKLLRGHVNGRTEQPPALQTSLLSLIFFTLWTLRLGITIPADVVHSHDFSPLPAAWLLARLRRARLVYDSHESAPDLYPGRKGRWIGTLERRLIGKADAVITVGERLAQALIERGARQVTVIGNWKQLNQYEVDPARIDAKRQEWHLTDAKLTITYIGDLTSTIYHLQPLIEAVCQSPDVTLFIAGRGDMETAIIEAAEHAPNIHWLGYLDISEVPIYTHIVDVVYCCLHPRFGQAYYVAPNKLFEAFAAGKAIIARRGVGELGEILERIPAGILLDDVTSQTLKEAFHELQNPERLRALHTASLQGRERYNWAIAEQRLRILYAELRDSHS
jgi:glycogen(starch) synthase